MVRLVFRFFLQVQRTICPSVSPRASTRVSLTLRSSQAWFTICQWCRHRHRPLSLPPSPLPPTHTDTDTHRQTDTDRQTHTHTFLHSEMVLAQLPPWWKVRFPQCGGTHATAEPGQPRLFSSCRRTCLESFDLLSGHGSGSNLSVTASEIKSRNSGICFCNGNYFSKPGICMCNRKLIRQIFSVCNDFPEQGTCLAKTWRLTTRAWNMWASLHVRWASLFGFEHMCGKRCNERRCKFYGLAAIVTEEGGTHHTINLCRTFF